MNPLAIDLYCGLGGWTDGLLAEGWRVVGFDIERATGEHRYPAQLVLQDVLTLHGAQFKDAQLIVASPPCQFFSYTAMPWTRAKNLAEQVRNDSALMKEKLALFDACFRIQREAIAAAARHIPLVVENVRGAQPWVGKAEWHYGSYYLWGDVPALMPMTKKFKAGDRNIGRADGGGHKWDTGFDVAIKCPGHLNHRDGHASTSHLTNPAEHGVKGFTPNGEPMGKNVLGRRHGSKSATRKRASAMIAKIPLPLARWIAYTYHP